MTEAKAKKELAEEEKKCLAAGGISVHSTNASAFVVMGLEIEETQLVVISFGIVGNQIFCRRRLCRLAKGIGSNATAWQEGGLTEQRNQLTNHIQVWEQILFIYMPGLLQYRAELRAANGDSPIAAEHPEEAELWLPSQIPVEEHRRVCSEVVPTIEEKLRTAQCHNALESLRHVLKVESRLI